MKRDGFARSRMLPKRAEIASSGSAKSLHLGGGSAPLAANVRLGRSQPASGDCASRDFVGAHAVEEIVLRIVLADMVEAQEAPAARPVEIGRLERRLEFARRAAAGDGALRPRPFDPPVHPGLLRRHRTPSI